MRRKNKKIDMLNGSIWDKMIVFALPLAFTGMLQQLFNAADVAVLGRFVSNESMAGVGNNVPVIGLIIAFCMGLALGANVVVARLLGMKEPERANRAVHTALATAVIFGIGAAIVGECFAGPAMDWLSVPEAVRDDALTYLRVYLLGMPFIAIYNFLAAVMRSQGDTQTPLWALVAATLVNIAGNLFFVLAFGMGTAGVALATVLANALAASLLFFSLITAEGPLHIEPREVFRIDMTALRPMVRIGWPAGLQGAVFSISNLVIQSAINSLGADAMAGSVAAFTIEINIYCFINAFGLAATTFVSQNYGAKNLERCKRDLRRHGPQHGRHRPDGGARARLRTHDARTLHGRAGRRRARDGAHLLGGELRAHQRAHGGLLERHARLRLLDAARHGDPHLRVLRAPHLGLDRLRGKPRLRDPDDRLSDQLGRHRRAAALPLRAPHEAHQAQVRGARPRSRSRLTSCPSTKTAPVKAGAVSVREDFQRLCRGLLEVG